MNNSEEKFWNALIESREQNWEQITRFFSILENSVGKNPLGATMRVMANRDLSEYFGHGFSDTQIESLIVVANTAYGQVVTGTWKRRVSQYLGRLSKLLERFPASEVRKDYLYNWKKCIFGLQYDMGHLQDHAVLLRQAEHFSNSALALTRIVSSWHDPELVTSLYLLEMGDRGGRSLKPQVQSYLLDKANRELEFLISPANRSFYSDFLDDEANIWWGIHTLFRWKKDRFKIHQFTGTTGFQGLLEGLLKRPALTYPKGELAKKEITLEVQGEQKTVLFVVDAMFMTADILEDYSANDLASRVRTKAIRLLQPFLDGRKLRLKNHIFMHALEAEVFSRMYLWHKERLRFDFSGKVLKNGSYR